LVRKKLIVNFLKFNILLSIDNQEKVEALYDSYNRVIRPLISEIEAREESFPTPLFNEIRAFNDHIARCYLPKIANEKIITELEKAEGHISRITLDCFKYLDVFLYEKIRNFEKRTRNIDLTVLDNGQFFPTFCKLKKDAVISVRQAKNLESMNIIKSLEFYQLAYNQYCDLENKIDDKTGEINWLKVRFSFNRLFKLAIWILAAILSGLLSLFLTCDSIANFIKSLI